MTKTPAPTLPEGAEYEIRSEDPKDPAFNCVSEIMFYFFHLRRIINKPRRAFVTYSNPTKRKLDGSWEAESLAKKEYNFETANCLAFSL